MGTVAGLGNRGTIRAWDPYDMATLSIMHETEGECHI